MSKEPHCRRRLTPQDVHILVRSDEKQKCSRVGVCVCVRFHSLCERMSCSILDWGDELAPQWHSAQVCVCACLWCSVLSLTRWYTAGSGVQLGLMTVTHKMYDQTRGQWGLSVVFSRPLPPLSCILKPNAHSGTRGWGRWPCSATLHPLPPEVTVISLEV